MFLSFICFSKLVILVYTGQLVENNTTYARYTVPQRLIDVITWALTDNHLLVFL